MNSRMQTSDDCKAEYAGELQKANDVQRDHYGNQIPQLFNVIFLFSVLSIFPKLILLQIKYAISATLRTSTMNGGVT